MNNSSCCVEVPSCVQGTAFQGWNPGLAVDVLAARRTRGTPEVPMSGSLSTEVLLPRSERNIEAPKEVCRAHRGPFDAISKPDSPQGVVPRVFRPQQSYRSILSVDGRYATGWSIRAKTTRFKKMRTRRARALRKHCEAIQVCCLPTFTISRCSSLSLSFSLVGDRRQYDASAIDVPHSVA
jgi:hypothetical protein